MHILRIGLEPAAAIDIAPAELVSRSPDPEEEPVCTGVSVEKAFAGFTGLSQLSWRKPRDQCGKPRPRSCWVRPESLAGLRRKRCIPPLGRLS
jgi:hypothetical protein